MRLRAPAGRANARRTLLVLLGDAVVSAERRMRRATIKQGVCAAVANAREHGCRCRLEVTVGELAPGLYEATVQHDDWCPLLRSITERPPSKRWRP